MGGCDWTNLREGPRVLDLSAYRNIHNISGYISEFNSSNFFANNYSFVYSPCNDWKMCSDTKPASIAIWNHWNGTKGNCTDITFFNNSNYGNPQWIDEKHGWYMYYEYYIYGRGNQCVNTSSKLVLT